MRPRKQLLGIVATLFAGTGSWPTEKDVQRRLSASHISVEVLMDLPAKLGAVEADGRVVLTVRALRGVASASDVVADFMMAVRFAAGRYRDWSSDPVISREELELELSLSPLRARRTMALLESEGLVRRLGEDGGAEVTAKIDRYASARGGRAYVRRRKAREAASRPSALTRLREWLQSREHTTRDLIAITAIGGIVAVFATAEISGTLNRAPAHKVDPHPSKIHHPHPELRKNPQRPELDSNQRPTP